MLCAFMLVQSPDFPELKEGEAAGEARPIMRRDEDGTATFEEWCYPQKVTGGLSL